MKFEIYAGVGLALAMALLVLAFSSNPFHTRPKQDILVPIATLESLGSTSPLSDQIASLLPSPTLAPQIIAAHPLSLALEIATTTATTTPVVPVLPPAPPVVYDAPKIEIPKIEAAPPVVIPSKAEPIIPPVVAPAPVVVAPPPPAPTPEPTPAPEPEPAPTPTPAPAPQPAVDTSSLGTLKRATVNILCSASGGSVRPITGSGVIFDSRGLIVTSAHIAQYYLLEGRPEVGTVSCTIRTGNPAKSAYYAQLVYLSAEWLKQNPDTLTTAVPKSSGAHDYAVLAITGSVSGSLPTSFPAVSLATKDVAKGDEVTIAAYAAHSTSFSEVKANLALSTATALIKERYSLDGKTVDVIGIYGGTSGDLGPSSGGPVMNAAGEIVGIISTGVTTGPYAARSMQAVTPAHMRRTFKSETGVSFSSYFARDINELVSGYQQTASELASTLLKSLGV